MPPHLGRYNLSNQVLPGKCTETEGNFLTQYEYSYTRYLAAKKSIDNRAINNHVWQVLLDSLPQISANKPLSVFEMGAGIGTMIERMLERDLFSFADYTAIDAQTENIRHAQRRLLAWATKHGYQAVERTDGLLIFGEGIEVNTNLVDVDLFDFIADQQNLGTYDLLVAHAFLDLVDLPDTLPQIFNFGQKDSLFYFTINYDGLAILEPIIDQDFDQHVLNLYHRTMSERIRDGKRFGDSRTGRHLFEHIQNAGGKILAVGSSDWFVFPGPIGYPQDEAYFLHFIIQTIYQALKNHPELDAGKFEEWIYLRHAQIERKELIYIAHQLDYVGATQRN
jgi:hypothetical protein